MKNNDPNFAGLPRKHRFQVTREKCTSDSLIRQAHFNMTQTQTLIAHYFFKLQNYFYKIGLNKNKTSEDYGPFNNIPNKYSRFRS